MRFVFCITIVICFVCLKLQATTSKPLFIFHNSSIADPPVATAVDSTKFKKVFYGTASFYSKSLEGTKTSTDETFSHNKLTCASNRFKLGTWLRVTNLSNNKSIIVRVNDRMHPKMDKKGRIVDLSYLGAKKLSFIKKGITKVKVEPVPKGTVK